MRKIELKVVAVSHSLSQSHGYALVLSEESGNRRLPIVIGGYEAQSIAVAFEKMSSQRPMTHDLIKNLCTEFDIKLKEVIINNLNDGIFFSKLICEQKGNTVEIDSRTSDAIAMALRFDAPIYTYEFILDQAALSIENEGERSTSYLTGITPAASNPDDITKKSTAEMQEQLNTYLEKEEYEKASAVRDELQRRSKSS
ncbi:MAG: bifunctional nuclease domain-containing protein [Bacteroidota bacterium]